MGVLDLSAQSGAHADELHAVTAPDGGSLVRWQAEAGIRYRLQSSLDMEYWRPEGTWLGLGQEVEVQVRAGSGGGGNAAGGDYSRSS